jgi:acetyl esterase/lipase
LEFEFAMRVRQGGHARGELANSGSFQRRDLARKNLQRKSKFATGFAQPGELASFTGGEGMSQRLLWMGGAGAVVGLGLLVWTFTEAQAPRPRVRQENDVVFASVADATLKVDVAMPVEGSGPFPAVICLHGGGWVGGERKQMSQTIEVLARRGYVAIAPDYRLAPTHRFPACIEDCKCAVRWLRANSGKYRVNPSRIAAVGLSAGGHLACLLGMSEAGDGLEGTAGHLDQSSRVQAVVNFAGPTDLTDETLHTPEVLKENLIPLMGGSPAECSDLYRKASPMHYSPRTPPPFLLIHGSADRVVPVRQAHAFADKLKRCGASVHVVELEGEGHTWGGASLIRSIDRMLTFLDESFHK